MWRRIWREIILGAMRCLHTKACKRPLIYWKVVSIRKWLLKGVLSSVSQLYYSFWETELSSLWAVSGMWWEAGTYSRIADVTICYPHCKTWKVFIRPWYGDNIKSNAMIVFYRKIIYMRRVMTISFIFLVTMCSLQHFSRSSTT